MNTLDIWEKGEFSKVRVFDIDGEAWFVGKDICEYFNDKNHNRTLSRVDDCDKQIIELKDCMGRNQKAIAVNESGMYSILFGMQPQKANKGGGSNAYPIEVQKRIEKLTRFKHWVTSEVLPSIRKTGGYQMQTPQGKELLALAVLEAQKTIEEQTAQIEEMKPHAVLGQAITTANTSILVGDLAKILKQNGIEIGAKRLFQWMRENGYLIKRKGTDWNLPTQRSMEMELFEIKESVHIDGNGCNKITRTPKVTGKGQEYFINKFFEGVA